MSNPAQLVLQFEPPPPVLSATEVVEQLVEVAKLAMEFLRTLAQAFQEWVQKLDPEQVQMVFEFLRPPGTLTLSASAHR